MKYKKIYQDKEMTEKVRAYGISKLAAELGVSRQYIHGAVSERYAIPEDLYLKIKEIVS